MEIIIDIIGYEPFDEEFIVKELCAINVSGEITRNGAYDCEYFMFKPPYDCRNEGLIAVWPDRG